MTVGENIHHHLTMQEGFINDGMKKGGKTKTEKTHPSRPLFSPEKNNNNPKKNKGLITEIMAGPI